MANGASLPRTANPLRSERPALARGTAGEWVRPTLLGLAFDRGDVAEAQRLLSEVATEEPTVWKLKTTVADLQGSIGRHADETVRRQLNGVLTALKDLIPPTSPAEGDDKELPAVTGTAAISPHRLLRG